MKIKAQLDESQTVAETVGSPKMIKPSTAEARKDFEMLFKRANTSAFNMEKLSPASSLFVQSRLGSKRGSVLTKRPLNDGQTSSSRLLKREVIQELSPGSNIESESEQPVQNTDSVLS